MRRQPIGLRASLFPALLLAVACSPDGSRCVPGWKAVFERAQLDRPILSLWGDGEVVYAVGGGVRATGLGALALRWDGSRWDELPVGRDETLWWVWGAPGGAEVWMVGERGLALRWDGRAFTVLPRLTDATLFGVWGSGPDDVWLVGGTPGAGLIDDNDVVLHWDGMTLAREGPPARGGAFFKVWGAAADDLWVVGEGGLVWRRTAEGWSQHDAGTRDSLTTVHGCAGDEVYAVGGLGIYRWDGAVWGRVEEAMPLSGVNGVACGRDQVLAVGNGGLKLRFRRDTGRWLDETLDPPFYSDYHAAWISPAGALWAAGGNYNAPPSTGRYGMLATDGCPVPR